MNDWRKMLKDCLKIEDGLTDWEVEFLESLWDRQERDPEWEPSDKQADILKRLWEEKT